MNEENFTREALVKELVAQGRSKYTTYNTGLYLSVINEEFHRQTCNYWYLITTGAQSHTAFETEAGLMRYLNERNLKLTQPLTPRGVPSHQKLEGGYFRCTCLDVEFFAELSKRVPPERHTKIMDNGDYTLGLLVPDENGVVTVYLLNPNCERVKYPHAAAALEMR